MTGKRIGYIRVSTFDQNPDRQLEGVKLDKKFIDYASASTTNRPQLKLLLDFVREDDQVFVHSMDRLARNLKDLRHLVDILISQKIEVHFIKENIVFDGKKNPISNLMLNLMGAFAEFERDFMYERQREGIELAKRRGAYKGPPKKVVGEKIEMIKDAMKTRMTKTEIAEKLGISRLTLYRALKEFNIA